MSFHVDAEIRRKDSQNLVLLIDGREFQINTGDIKRVISEGQDAAQVKEVRPFNRAQQTRAVV